MGVGCASDDLPLRAPAAEELADQLLHAGVGTRAPQLGPGQAISASVVIQSLACVGRCLAGS
jgi:hypothetical protein